MEKKDDNFFHILNNIFKNLNTLLLFLFIFAVLSFVVSKYLISPKYESSTSMIVSSSNVNEKSLTDVDLGQINANRALVSTYSEIVKSRGVADRVIANLDLDMDYEEFSDKVSIEPIKDTQIISVKVVDTIPERAQDIANETSMIFKDSITKIMNIDNIQILDKATLPDEPSSPIIILNTIIGAVLGIILGMGMVMIKELSDTRIKTSEDVTTEFDIPVLGLIPDRKKFK